jgi:hypothetical protein
MKARAGVTALILAGVSICLAPASGVAQKKQRDLITREEILNSGKKDQDIFQVIRALRPHFLLPPRGVRSSVGGPRPSVLYVNGNRTGELAQLRNILAADVFEVKYLDPSKAENEFGIGHSGGAVMVTLVKGIKSNERIVPPAR